jgi:hypothetical protein
MPKGVTVKRLVAALVAGLACAAAVTPIVHVAAAGINGPRVAVAGDVSCVSNASSGSTCRAGATGDLIRDYRNRRVLALGDLQYETGSLTDFRRSYDAVWGSFKGKTRPVPGNHEYYSGGAGFYTYFSDVVSPAGTQSFTLGEWRVIGLNTNCERIDCNKHAAWLDSQLDTAGRCVLVYGHHPVHSSGSHGDTDWMDDTYRPVMNAHGVDLYLAGHDHSYERFVPTSGDSFRQFVIGTGGKNLYDFPSVHPGSEVRIRAHGVGFFTLGDGAYRWQFRGIDGRVLDGGTDSCV